MDWKNPASVHFARPILPRMTVHGVTIAVRRAEAHIRWSRLDGRFPLHEGEAHQMRPKVWKTIDLLAKFCPQTLHVLPDLGLDWVSCGRETQEQVWPALQPSPEVFVELGHTLRLAVLQTNCVCDELWPRGA